MPARAVVISSFTKFDGRGFPSLTSGQLTQLMGRAGRRGIDKVGHGVILKDPEVDIGVIYEAAMGEDMVVESKFAPNYNMALNLLRNRDLKGGGAADGALLRSVPATPGRRQRRRELANLKERLKDLERIAVRPSGREKCTAAQVQQYFRDEVQIRNLRNRIRRAKRDHYHRGNAGIEKQQLAEMRKEIVEIQHRQRSRRSAAAPTCVSTAPGRQRSGSSRRRSGGARRRSTPPCTSTRATSTRSSRSSRRRASCTG